MILNSKAIRLAWIFIFLAPLILPKCVHAQDVHFSQFDNANLIINPALTASGVESGRISMQAKQQWTRGLINPFRTIFASYEAKINPCDNSNKHKWSYGFSIMNDDAGASNLTLTQVTGSLSYTYQMAEEIGFTLGALGGFNNRSFESGLLSAGNQYDPILQIYDSSIPLEGIPDMFSTNFETVGLGFNFYGKQSKVVNDEGVTTRQGRSTLNFGGAIYNLTRPNVAFTTQDYTSKLGFRYTLYMVPTIELTRSVDLRFKAFAEFQNTYFESLFDGGLVFHMKDAKNNPISFGLSTGVRLWSLDNGIDPSTNPNQIVDAIIPAITASVKGVDVGFAFDINISKFSEANNRRGGPELFIRKRIFNCLVTPPFRPNCNIF